MNDTAPLTVRVATPADAGTVHSMIAALAASTPSHIEMRSTPADFETALSGEHPALFALIALQDDSPLGLVVFFPTFSTWYGAPGVYVQDLYVNESARGAGVGKRLMAEVAKFAAARGATHLRLSVDCDNAAGQAFYGRIGMSHRDDEMMYMIEGAAFARLGAEE